MKYFKYKVLIIIVIYIAVSQTDINKLSVVRIKYEPNEKILESKSVRDYLALWRNKRNWQEYVTEEIANVLYERCEPKWLLVEIEWSPRGGILAKTISKLGDVP